MFNCNMYKSDAMCQFNLHILVYTLFSDLACLRDCTVYVVGVGPVSWPGSLESVTQCWNDAPSHPGKLSEQHQQ